MRIVLILILLSFGLGLNAQEQPVRINANYEGMTAKEILKDVKKRYGVRFAYDPQAMKELRTDLSLTDADIPTFLNGLLDGSGFIFERIKRTYVIREGERLEASSDGPQRYDFELTGRVRDRESGEPLPYASIGFLGTSVQTLTTLDGRFTFLSVPNDTLIIAVSYLGYTSYRRRVNTIEGSDFTISMNQNDTYLPAVDIVAEMPRMIRTLDQAGHIEIDPMNLRSLSNYGHQDLFKTIQFTPGVSSNDGTKADLNIRGGGNDENLILWDGFTIYHLDHLFGVFSTINPEVVKNVQVHKSSYGAAYGGRSSGVLDITGLSGDKKKESLSLTADLISLGVKAETPLIKDKMSLLVSFRRAMSDVWDNGLYQELFNTVYNESVANEEGVTVTRNDVDPEFYFYDVNAKVDLELSDRNRVSFSLFHGRDVYTNSVFNQFTDDSGPETQFLTDRVDDEADWGNIGLGAVWENHWSERSYSRTSLGASDYRSQYFFSKTEIDSSAQQVTNRFESDFRQNRLRDITLRHAHTLVDEEGAEILIGYQFNRLDLGYSDYERRAFNATLLTDSSAAANIHTLFAERKQRLGEDTEVSYGGRISSNSYTDKLYFEPRASFHYSFSDHLSGSLAVGNYVQFIRRLAEQNIFLDQPDLWVLSDGDQFDELQSLHLTGGMQWRFKGWNISLEPYLKRVRGSILNRQQIRLLSTFDNIDAQFVSGKTNILGFDVFIQRTFRGHSGWIGYSATRSSNLFEEVNKGAEFPSPFNKANDLKLIYTYKYKDWEFGSTAVYATGYLFTPLLGTFPNGNDVFQAVYGTDLSSILPDYFRWDATISKQIRTKNVDVTLSLGVYNLTNRNNIGERVYEKNQVREQAGEDLNIKTSDLELLGIRPNFSIRLDIK